MEFALLRCWEEVHRDLKWDSIITNDVLAVLKIVLTTEKAIRKALKESLTTKFPSLGANDVEFVKVRDKAVSALQS